MTCEKIRNDGFDCQEQCNVRSPAGLAYKTNKLNKAGDNLVVEIKETEPVQEKLIVPFSLTDLGNAERLVYRHGENIRFVWGRNKWIFWNGKYWQEDNYGHIQRLAKDTVRKIHQEIDLLSGLDDEKFKKKVRKSFPIKENPKAKTDKKL